MNFLILYYKKGFTIDNMKCYILLWETLWSTDIFSTSVETLILYIHEYIAKYYKKLPLLVDITDGEGAGDIGSNFDYFSSNIFRFNDCNTIFQPKPMQWILT